MTFRANAAAYKAGRGGAVAQRGVMRRVKRGGAHKVYRGCNDSCLEGVQCGCSNKIDSVYDFVENRQTSLLQCQRVINGAMHRGHLC